MLCLEVSSAVRHICMSLGGKGLKGKELLEYIHDVAYNGVLSLEIFSYVLVYLLFIYLFM
jgi:hypothetical protein